MTRAPHEIPRPGPAADFAAALSARLPAPETDRLRLRALRLTDFDAFAKIMTGPAGAFMGGPFERDEAFREFAGLAGLWLLRGHGGWTVEARDTGAVLGFVLIGFEPGDREPELGFLFLPEAEGRGLAHEAARAARAHAFGTAGLSALVSYTDPANDRANALARRLNARPAGMVDGALVWRHEPEPAT